MESKSSPSHCMLGRVGIAAGRSAYLQSVLLPIRITAFDRYFVILGYSRVSVEATQISTGFNCGELNCIFLGSLGKLYSVHIERRTLCRRAWGNLFAGFWFRYVVGVWATS